MYNILKQKKNFDEEIYETDKIYIFIFNYKKWLQLFSKN